MKYHHVHCYWNWWLQFKGTTSWEGDDGIWWQFAVIGGGMSAITNLLKTNANMWNGHVDLLFRHIIDCISSQGLCLFGTVWGWLVGCYDCEVGTLQNEMLGDDPGVDRGVPGLLPLGVDGELRSVLLVFLVIYEKTTLKASSSWISA